MTDVRGVGPTAVLFTDVEGSTALRSAHGDRVADALLEAHERLVRAEITGHGGRVVQFLGDGFLAAFDGAGDAVRAAQAIQRALEEHNRAQSGELRVRIGVHVGSVSERDDNLYGQAVHAAARVMAEAAGGQILVSEDVTALVPDVAYRDRGEFWLKGFPTRWRLYEVPWGEGAAPASAPVPGLTPFVGREGERAEFRRLVDRALGGQGCLVFVAGEPGVGKTRLVQEVRAEAGARGMRVLEGHSVELEGGTAYLPFVELLEQALLSPRSPRALRAALGDLAPEIARMVPSLRRLMPDLPPPIELPPDQARRYLWNSVVEFIDRAARDQPLLLHLEDLHWADESSLALLEHLAPHLPAMPVLLVGTYRDTEVGPDHPLAHAVNNLLRRHLMSRIALRRLGEQGVGAMVSGLAGQAAPIELVQVVHEETDGNPFFVEEVYLHLSESGMLLDEDGRFRAGLRIDELDVPESLRLVIGGRLARLSAPTRDALAAAAVVGRTFSGATVARLTDQTPDALAEVLHEAERARLVVPAPDGIGLMFNHELIRQTLLSDTSTVQRQLLHARAAEAVEAEHTDDPAGHAADIVHHLLRAGPHADTPRLVRYLQVAGERALEATAFDDAVGYLERALALVSGEDPRRAALLERLAMARRSVGQWNQALHAMDEALERYQRLGSNDDVGRVCWTMVYQLAWGARFEEAFAVASRGLEALGTSETADRARLMSALGWVTSLAGDYEAATGLFEAARALAERLGDKRALADALHMETVHDLGYARFPEGIEAGRAAADVFDAEGAVWDLCSVLSFVLYQAGAMGRRDLARSLTARVEPLAEELGHLGATFLTLADRVRAEGVLPADFTVIDELAPRQIEVCERGGLPWLYVGYLYLGFVAHWRGAWHEAERQLRTAAELEAPGAFSGQGLGHLAVHLAHAGHADEVQALAEQQPLPVAGRVNSLGTWNAMLLLTEALYVAGRREAAAARLPLVEEFLAIGTPEWMLFDGRITETVGGMAAAAAGQWEQAEARYRSAADTAARMGHRIEAVEVQRFHARMLLDRAGPGDRDRARTMLRQAADGYRALGMPRHVDLAVELLDSAAG